jgi:hypothetical protein
MFHSQGTLVCALQPLEDCEHKALPPLLLPCALLPQLPRVLLPVLPCALLVCGLEPCQVCLLRS